MAESLLHQGARLLGAAVRFAAGVEHQINREGDLQRALRHCRSRKELILAARRLGYRITRIDLQRAWQEEQAEAEGQQQAGNHTCWVRKASARQ